VFCRRPHWRRANEENVRAIPRQRCRARGGWFFHQEKRRHAERCGAASPQPLPVTPRGDAEAATLIEKFKAITDPAEQTAFWRSLSAEKRALILNAK
jgi:hypothetical protein